MFELIVGLGNYGDEYKGTRHNVGFSFLDLINERLFSDSLSFKFEKKFQADLVKASLFGKEVAFMLPRTFMNLSGEAVGSYSKYYGIAPENILVIQDELDFAPGIVKLKFGGGAAGHNGLKSIIAHLGTPDFYRLRFGIGKPQNKDEMINFVLGRPSPADRQLIQLAFAKAIDNLEKIIKNKAI